MSDKTLQERLRHYIRNYSYSFDAESRQLFQDSLDSIDELEAAVKERDGEIERLRDYIAVLSARSNVFQLAAQKWIKSLKASVARDFSEEDFIDLVRQELENPIAAEQALREGE